MASDYKLFWSDEAIAILESILDYLNDKWSKKEIINFKKQLTKQLDYLLPIQNYFQYPSIIQE